MKLLPLGIWIRRLVAGQIVLKSRIFVFVFFLLACLAGSRAFGKVHPVPLDKNTDAAKCVECHDDKSKGKSVHSAMAMGCLSCHEVRVNKDVTRVILITA